MKTIRLVGEVDKKHRLSARVPAEVPPGRVDLTILVPDESSAAEEDKAWISGITQAWAEDLADSRQDLYTLDDGEPVDERG